MLEQMVSDLRALGLGQGDVVLMHSAFKSLGWKDGRPRDVVEALKEVLGEAGTLLVPALSYEYCHEGQRVFDVTQTRSCVGAISEVFRNMKGVVRSVHPTHSVCGWGARAKAMLCEHHLDETPCGALSPYAKLRDAGGKVLMLGCGLEPNTSMHGVEELVRPAYLFTNKIEYEVRVGEEPERCAVDRKRVPELMDVWRHGHSHFGYVQRYDRLQGLMGDDVMKKGQVLAAECWLLDVAAMWEVGEAKLRENALYFVDELRIGS